MCEIPPPPELKLHAVFSRAQTHSLNVGEGKKNKNRAHVRMLFSQHFAASLQDRRALIMYNPGEKREGQHALSDNLDATFFWNIVKKAMESQVAPRGGKVQTGRVQEEGNLFLCVSITKYLRAGE